MTKSLKQEVRPQLATVLVANLLVFGVLITTHVLALPAIQRDFASAVKSVGLSAVALALCTILTEQFGQATKARIVFWRWTDPLPGSRAFTDIGPSDPRIDMGDIGRAIGELPTEPKAQNALWYKFSRKVEQEPMVRDVHRLFLFARDYACLSILFVLSLGPLAVWRLGHSAPSLIYWLLLVAQYLLARNAAANTGRRFVATVLAAQVSGPPGSGKVKKKPKNESASASDA
jgi:hypothetical protein